MAGTPDNEDPRNVLFCMLYDVEFQHELFLLVALELPDEACARVLRRLAALESDQDWRQGFTYLDGSWRLHPRRHTIYGDRIRD